VWQWLLHPDHPALLPGGSLHSPAVLQWAGATQPVLYGDLLWPGVLYRWGDLLRQRVLSTGMAVSGRGAVLSAGLDPAQPAMRHDDHHDHPATHHDHGAANNHDHASADHDHDARAHDDHDHPSADDHDDDNSPAHDHDVHCPTDDHDACANDDYAAAVRVHRTNAVLLP
jgi:hypothetical protein